MRKMFFALAMPLMMLMATAASANEAEMSFCEMSADLARGFMDARQSGVPLVALRQNLQKVSYDRTDSNLAAFAEMADDLLLLAYEQPQYSGKAAQDRAISDYESDVYLHCVQRFE